MINFSAVIFEKFLSNLTFIIKPIVEAGYILKKNIIVTGGAGFIGSHLVDSLMGKENKVIVLDNFITGRKNNLDHLSNKIELFKCDISQTGKWQELFKDVDWVFHLAALADIVPSIEKPDDYYQSNVNGTFNILQACIRYNVKKIINYHVIISFTLSISVFD